MDNNLPNPHPGEILQGHWASEFLGNALYVAAHPDDENTRLISAFGQWRKCTYHLFVAHQRGWRAKPDWSWNWRAIGVIRTQEFIAGQKDRWWQPDVFEGQWFWIPKNAEETISIWDNEQVNTTWFGPFVKPGQTWSSIVLITAPVALHTATIQHRPCFAHELFEKGCGCQCLQRSTSHVAPWKASRLYFNVSWFFFGSQEAFNKAEKSHLLSFEVGSYYPLLASPIQKFLALSRSKHKCRGFAIPAKRAINLSTWNCWKAASPPTQKIYLKASILRGPG